MTKYSSWNHYFRHNNWSAADLCPPGVATLSAQERELIGASLQQFQLGEGSDGLGLLRRANEFSKRHNVDSLPEAMQRFVCEEQRHSAVLGLFLDRESIPRLQHHWVDHLFRRIRNLAGFELMLTVLVTAEFIAIPYYMMRPNLNVCGGSRSAFSAMRRNILNFRLRTWGFVRQAGVNWGDSERSHFSGWC
jgi:hypothetical protein